MINTYGSKYTTRKKYDKTVCNEFLKKIMPASSKFQKVGLKNYSLIFWGDLTSLQVYTVILRTRHYQKVRRRVLWSVRPSHAGASGLVLCRDRPHSVASTDSVNYIYEWACESKFSSGTKKRVKYKKNNNFCRECKTTQILKILINLSYLKKHVVWLPGAVHEDGFLMLM